MKDNKDRLRRIIEHTNLESAKAVERLVFKQIRDSYIGEARKFTFEGKWAHHGPHADHYREEARADEDICEGPAQNRDEDEAGVPSIWEAEASVPPHEPGLH